MIKYYWLRFLSRTPKPLKKLQLFLSGLFVVVGGVLESINKFDMDVPTFETVLQRGLLIIPFMVLILQFTTSDEKLQEKL